MKTLYKNEKNLTCQSQSDNVLLSGSREKEEIYRAFSEGSSLCRTTYGERYSFNKLPEVTQQEDNWVIHSPGNPPIKRKITENLLQSESGLVESHNIKDFRKLTITRAGENVDQQHKPKLGVNFISSELDAVPYLDLAGDWLEN